MDHTGVSEKEARGESEASMQTRRGFFRSAGVTAATCHHRMFHHHMFRHGQHGRCGGSEQAAHGPVQRNRSLCANQPNRSHHACSSAPVLAQ